MKGLVTIHSEPEKLSLDSEGKVEEPWVSVWWGEGADSEKEVVVSDCKVVDTSCDSHKLSDLR